MNEDNTTWEEKTTKEYNVTEYDDEEAGLVWFMTNLSENQRKREDGSTVLEDGLHVFKS
jgi:hypothetical protein